MKINLGFGSYYRGEVRDGKMHGQGEFHWPIEKKDGLLLKKFNRYIGQFDNGLLDGDGVLYEWSFDRQKEIFLWSDVKFEKDKLIISDQMKKEE